MGMQRYGPLRAVVRGLGVGCGRKLGAATTFRRERATLSAIRWIVLCAIAAGPVRDASANHHWPIHATEDQAAAECLERDPEDPFQSEVFLAGSRPDTYRNYLCMWDAEDAAFAAELCADGQINGAVVTGRNELVACGDMAELAANWLAEPCGEAAVQAFAVRHFAELSGLWIDVLAESAYQFGFVLGDLQCGGLVVIGQACEASSFELGCRPEPPSP